MNVNGTNLQFFLIVGLGNTYELLCATPVQCAFALFMPTPDETGEMWKLENRFLCRGGRESQENLQKKMLSSSDGSEFRSDAHTKETTNDATHATDGTRDILININARSDTIKSTAYAVRSVTDWRNVYEVKIVSLAHTHIRAHFSHAHHHRHCQIHNSAYSKVLLI